MAIQAISSVTNKGYSNISFGKRGEKPVKNHNVTSPMKAVPLAVLIAMSPLTTTNAENIMRAENNANTIELAQNPQSRVLMYAEGFTSQNGTKVAVMAFNTKGGTDSFDQILLKAGKYTFEAKDLVDREIYLYNQNGAKEGPIRLKEVIGETELNGEKARFSFIDPQVVSYVEAVISQPTNQSNIKEVRKDHSNLIVANKKGDLLFVDDDFINDSHASTVSSFKYTQKHTGDAVTYMYKVKPDKLIQTPFGNYKLGFYDYDENKNDFEALTLLPEGSNWDFNVRGVTFIDGKIRGMDNTMDTGIITAIELGTGDELSDLNRNNLDLYSFIICDDILGAEIVKALQDPAYNNNSRLAVKVNQHVSNLVLGDE